jgi:hypothetical protein
VKPWQKGYELDELRAIALQFQAHDGDRCLGAFSKVKENTVANWLADGKLRQYGSAIVVARQAKSRQAVKDFRGATVAYAPVGTTVIERVAGNTDCLIWLLNDVAQYGPMLWKGWANHPDELEAVDWLRLSRYGTFISASSEVRAIWGRGLERTDDLPHPADSIGICHVAEPTERVGAYWDDLQSWIPLVSELWQDHYSSYNKRKSWHAVALRSFGGDMAFIEKPAEMSKQWKAEHADMIDAQCVDTPLFDQLPNARAVVGTLKAETERVRLMRLSSGGGELSRHADITDRNAGIRNGQIARFHLPIVTDPTVEFTSWDQDDRPRTHSMAPGFWWYLDVRKPHRAINPSGVEGVLLVVDLVVNDWVRSVLVPNN